MKVSFRDTYEAVYSIVRELNAVAFELDHMDGDNWRDGSMAAAEVELDGLKAELESFYRYYPLETEAAVKSYNAAKIYRFHEAS